MSKKFEGEGNPSSNPFNTIELPKLKVVDPNPICGEGRWVELSESEVAVLKAVLDRERTSAIVHGGLRSLLTLSDDATSVLLNFLRRI